MAVDWGRGGDLLTPNHLCQSWGSMVPVHLTPAITAHGGEECPNMLLALRWKEPNGDGGPLTLR
jgi:hypothetical protein